MPEGRITRGTTGTNRLRRVDRWIAASSAFAAAERPLVVDLGYGAAHWTASELLDRLRRANPLTRVVGLEIDPNRVAAAMPFERDGLSFARGGFEVPLPRGERATVIRALNVLRQYDESEVAAAWALMASRLAPGGLVVDGTSNEIGRIASWVALDSSGPQTFTISLRLAELERPGIVEERLPKALIHRNVPGERIHALIADLDRLWAHTAGYAEFGAQQRWLETVRRLSDHGWTVLTPPRRRRLGELTLPWPEVAPR
ncbi:class I SAM-dependent methyltransferase [Naasia lichenicola]|uniref:Class I SAM-dependent methyltransferase n=1 Tax=Naasia lichenicola TaxID=2565933 RepID=A0A4S4FKV1_9MICO|nr:class I SAM-dependent methyltransferase [Naasia lichenicola]THG29816.1 class I SAM-dependent methyltransferase [Naasia lichenicola]